MTDPRQLSFAFDALDAFRAASLAAPATATFRDMPEPLAERWHHLMVEIYDAARRACR